MWLLLLSCISGCWINRAARRPVETRLCTLPLVTSTWRESSFISWSWPTPRSRTWRATRRSTSPPGRPTPRPSSTCWTLLRRPRYRGLIRERLHRLPVPQRIRFELRLSMYKVMRELTPELFERISADGRSRYSARGDLAVRRTRTKFGDRAPCGPGARPSPYPFTTPSFTSSFFFFFSYSLYLFYYFPSLPSLPK